MNHSLSTTSFLPVIKSSDGGFFQYLKEIQKFPILTLAEEYEYGTRLQRDGDKEAAKMLVQSHLRLVVKIASKFRNYGLPFADLISEGNLGLIQAVKKFDPEKGFRLATYAMWWIKAYIQEYILRSWSLVKIGTTVAQRKLFFHLRKLKRKISNDEEVALQPKQARSIAKSLNVSEQDVMEMDSRLQNCDSSLNQVIGDEEEGNEVINMIACERPSQEELAGSAQEKGRRHKLLQEAFLMLKDREKEVIKARLLNDNPSTLEELSQIYQVSRERIRQIQDSALNKLKRTILASAN